MPLGLIVATRGEGSAALVVGFVFAAFGVLTIFGSIRGGSGGVEAGVDGDGGDSGEGGGGDGGGGGGD